MKNRSNKKVTIGMALTFVMFLVVVIGIFAIVGFGINFMSHDNNPYIALFGKNMMWFVPLIVVVYLIFALNRKNRLDNKK